MRSHDPSPPRSSRRRGFTLIEAIMSIVIVSATIPPTIILIHDAHLRRAAPILANRARWLASEKLEDIIADRHSSTRGWNYIIQNNYPSEPAVTGFPAFSRSVAITDDGPLLTGASNGYRTVNVTVLWTDPQRGQTSLSIATVLTRFSP